MSHDGGSSIDLMSLYLSKSRWSSIAGMKNILPNIFPDPRDPLGKAKMTLNEPPQELMEKYIEAKSTDERLGVLGRFYDKMKGVVFSVSCLLQDLEMARQAASEKRKAVYQLLGEVLDLHTEHKANGRPTKVKARLSELVVHPLNTRIIPHDEDASIGNFDQLCKDRGLKDPLLVVPVAPQGGSTKRVAEDEKQAEVKTLAEVHMKLFEFIQQKIMMVAKSDTKLNHAIELNGIGWVMRAVTGYREVMLKDGRLVFTENDPFHKAFRELGIRLEGPKYFILDGQVRALAMWRDFLQGLKDGTYSPDSDEVYVEIIYDADPLTVAYLSIILNTGLREVSEEELRSFLGGAGWSFSAALRTIADRVRSKIVEDASKKYRYDREQTSPRLVMLGKDASSRRGLSELSQPSEEESKEEEREREEKRWWEGREELAVEEATRPAVSEVQRQFAPASSYAPAQPQPSAQMPISPPAQPVREEASRSADLPKFVEVAYIPFDVKVLASFLDTFKDSLLYWDWGMGGEVKMKMEFSASTPTMKEWLKGWPKEQSRLVRLVEFANKPVEVDRFRLLVSGHLPFCVKEVVKVAEGEPRLVTCPDCNIPVPLIPICPKCLKPVRSDLLLPYEFAYKPE
jgi:hypothetical protein